MGGIRRSSGRCVLGALLLIALLVPGLGGAPAARAATTNIPDGDVDALIAAIIAANEDPDPDVIVLAAGSIYTLTEPDVDDVLQERGLPRFTTDITIVGNGATITRSDDAPGFRILEVWFDASVTLQQVTISNGLVDRAGGIYNRGTLTLIDCFISGNTADENDGGAIWNDIAEVTLINTVVSGNSAGDRNGGGIFNRGEMTLTNSIVSGNTSGGGGGIYNIGELTITDSTVSGNIASSTEGGGIFSNNSLTLTNSTVSGNRSSRAGGGIFVVGTFISTNSTISGNSSLDGGGGIFNIGELVLINSTVTNNRDVDEGGGIFSIMTVTLTNTVVAGNTAPTAPDIRGSVTGTFSLVGNGAGTNGLMHGIDGNQVGTSQAPINPLLGPLADNGGPTQTHLPGYSSPVINAADTAAGPTTDQRGLDRPSGVASDIGAVEVVIPTHAELCAMTQQMARKASVARSACALLLIAQAADQQGNAMFEQLALVNYQLQVRAAQGRRYISAADAAELMAIARLL